MGMMAMRCIFDSQCQMYSFNMPCTTHAFLRMPTCPSWFYCGLMHVLPLV